jgi:hypothetical protein
MSILQADVIDFITWDDDRTVSLMVSDHLEWTDPARHIRLLEAKIGGYLAYIESGGLQREHDKARGREVWIRVWGNFAPTLAGEIWHKQAKRKTKKVGVRYEFRHRPLVMKNGEWRLG